MDAARHDITFIIYTKDTACVYGKHRLLELIRAGDKEKDYDIEVIEETLNPTIILKKMEV